MASEEDLHELVHELVELRRAAEIPASEVARRMGTSLMSVRRIERGDVVPSVEAAERYASAVGAHLSWRLEELAEELPDASRVGARVDVDWGLDEPMSGRVIGVHGSPGRVWLQVELDEGPLVDVPAESVRARRLRSKRGRQ